MAEKSGFFNSLETSEGVYDREYDAEQFANYFANFISNGVYANPANQLKVVYTNSGTNKFALTVRKGKAYIDGYWYELTEDETITISANTSANTRKDVIVCRLDKSERKVYITTKQGVSSDLPSSTTTLKELVLATILVRPNVSTLYSSDLEDKRTDTNYCGFVTGMVDQIDTTELFKQYDSSFQEWFDEIKGQLSTDAAGNLQEQIGTLGKLNTTNNENLVAAINELDAFRKQIIDTIYPVGSVYLSFSPTSPQVFFGGEWENIIGTSVGDSEPRFLRLMNPDDGTSHSAGQKGGSSTHRHKSSLQYKVYYGNVSGSDEEAIMGGEYDESGNVAYSNSTKKTVTVYSTVNNAVQEGSKTTGMLNAYATMGSTYESSIPPYTFVYGWRRTA